MKTYLIAVQELIAALSFFCDAIDLPPFVCLVSIDLQCDVHCGYRGYASQGPIRYLGCPGLVVALLCKSHCALGFARNRTCMHC